MVKTLRILLTFSFWTGAYPTVYTPAFFFPTGIVSIITFSTVTVHDILRTDIHMGLKFWLVIGINHLKQMSKVTSPPKILSEKLDRYEYWRYFRRKKCRSIKEEPTRNCKTPQTTVICSAKYLLPPSSSFTPAVFTSTVITSTVLYLSYSNFYYFSANNFHGACYSGHIN